MDPVPVAFATLAALALTACATTTSMGTTTGTLTGGEWHVVQVGEQAVIPNSRASLAFAEDGRLAGIASCNRLTGRYTQEGTRLMICPTALTRMACPPAEMEQEAALVGLLGQVTHYEFNGSGALVLRSPAGVAIVARR